MSDRLNKKLILIIDDDKENVNFLKRRFRRFPHWTVEVAQDGEKGVDLTRSLNPNLIILDLLLPKISGFKVAKIIKKNPQLAHIPIVMISSIYNDEDVEGCRRLGVNKFFPKSDIFIRHSETNGDLFLDSIKSFLGEEVMIQTIVPEKVFLVGEGAEMAEVEKWLAGEGFKVMSAPFSPDVLKLKEEFCPNVVIMCATGLADSFPGLRQLKASPDETKVLVIGKNESQRVETLRGQADGFLTTPINYHYLELLIAKVCEEAKLRVSEKLLRHSMIEKVKEFEKLNEELQTLDQQKSDFITIASHELRTPLSVIKTAVENLQMANLKAEYQVFLELIKKHVEKLTNIVTTYMDISKIDAGGVKLEKKPIPVSQLVQDVIFSYELLAQKKKISLEQEIAKDIPEIEGDIHRCKDILGNLLDNAIKFTPEGGQVKIYAATDGDMVRLTVSDNGIGIHEKYFKKIFEKFSQVEDPLYRRAQGSGLGLFIVRRLTELQGGRLSLESELNKGSRFHISLPQVK